MDDERGVRGVVTSMSCSGEVASPSRPALTVLVRQGELVAIQAAAPAGRPTTATIATCLPTLRSFDAWDTRHRWAGRPTVVWANMWTTVVVLALALNLEPNRLGIIGLLFMRPHPIRQLLAFLGTSFLITSTVGLIVLFVVDRSTLLKGNFNGPIIQVGMGGLALIVAAALFTTIPLPGHKSRAADRPVGSPDDSPEGSAAVPSAGPGLVDTITKRAGRLAKGSSPWFAAALGLGISLPSVDYIAILLLFGASGEQPAVQVTALFTFLILANAILLTPIIGYLIAKEPTMQILESLRSWVLARSRRDYALLLAIIGTLLITVGLSHL